jgi:hypothetical protein
MASRAKKKRGGSADEVLSRLRGPVPSPALAPDVRGGATLGVVVGGTPYQSKSQGPGFTLDILDLDASEELPKRIKVPFLPHGFSPHPKRPRIAALFEKRGPGAGCVDLVEGRFLKTMAPKEGHHFYGHGLYSVQGDVIFAVEMRLDTSAGVITVRDSETFRVLGEFPSFGERPHDCMLVDEGRVLAITNGGGRLGSSELGSVSFVDVADRHLLDKREIGTRSFNAGHVAITGAGQVAVVSAPREGLSESELGGVSLAAGSPRLTPMANPHALVRRLVGEALSVCVHEPSGHVVVTHPYANLVTIWHLEQKRLLREIEMESPRGVTLTADDRRFVISHGPRASLELFDAQTLERVGSRGVGVAAGSHIYTWAYPQPPSAAAAPPR